MKRIIIITIFFLGIIHFQVYAQENHGRTLNLGVGVGGYFGYYNYIGQPLPVFHVDYEFNLVKNFTLAPFVNFYTYSNERYWGDVNNIDQFYTYREIVVPIGAKGTFYFDELFNASDKWDFYASASLGFSLANRHWESGYNGDRGFYRGARPLFLDAHTGAEYHFNKRMGVYLDLSSGVSTIGLAIH
jgi:hypothetical protein